jgi:putative phage-type endonuclease
MIRLTCAQRSPEWFAARLGVPTASQFSKILTPRTMKPSASADGYLYSLLAEWATGFSQDETLTAFMQRGTDLEDEAVALYELQHDVSTEEVGFILRDDRMVGCSPDRLVGDDGLLEIKAPSAAVHIRHLLADDLPDDHRCQVQGQLYISGRAWADVLSYCPGLPPALVRVQRDGAFIAALAREVDSFVLRLQEARAEMERRGFAPKVAA